MISSVKDLRGTKRIEKKKTTTLPLSRSPKSSCEKKVYSAENELIIFGISSSCLVLLGG